MDSINDEVEDLLALFDAVEDDAMACSSVYEILREEARAERQNEPRARLW